MDVQFIGPGQPPNPVDPLVHPLTNFTFYDGGATHFSEDFHLDAGCPEPRDYDDIGASGNGTLTHGWNNSTSNGCVVMSHLQDNTQYGYNTIFMSLNWFDISSFFTQSTDAPGQLLSNILNGLFPLGLNPDPEGDPCLAADTTATSVNQSTAVAAPKYLQLSQNTPNPFNPRTRIDFGLPADGHVALYIYDVQGRLVHTLVEAKMEAGYHHVEWDGTTRSGTDAATGIYWCKLASGGAASVRKMVLLR